MDNNENFQREQGNDEWDAIFNEVVKKTRMIIDKNDPIYALLICFNFFINKFKSELIELNKIQMEQFNIELQNIQNSSLEISTALKDEVIQKSLNHVLALMGNVAVQINDLRMDNEITRKDNRKTRLLASIALGVIFTLTIFIFLMIIKN